MNESVSKEEKILAAARALFNRHGPKKTTIDDVARDAGLGKGTIYLYFKSKDEIFLTCVRREMADLRAKLRQAVRGDGDVEERLRRWMTVRLQHMDDILERLNYNLELIREGHSQPGMEQLHHEHVGQEAEIVQGLLEEGCERGEIQCRDVALASLAVVSMMMAMCFEWMHHGRRLRPDDKVAVFVDLVMNGLRPR